MTRPKTLNNLRELKESSFGRPRPRHGLKLLYCFADHCLYFDNNNRMCWKKNPAHGCFGFKRFMNNKENNGVRLLPCEEIYYTVGNLNSEGAEKLEYYVMEDKTGNCDKSNMDRIIVSVRGNQFTNVYITQHVMYQSYYNKNATYKVSKELIKRIKDMNRDDFLRETGYLSKQKAISESSDEDMANSTDALIQPMRRLQISQPHTRDTQEQCCTCSPCVIL